MLVNLITCCKWGIIQQIQRYFPYIRLKRRRRAQRRRFVLLLPGSENSDHNGWNRRNYQYDWPKRNIFNYSCKRNKLNRFHFLHDRYDQSGREYKIGQKFNKLLMQILRHWIERQNKLEKYRRLHGKIR